jgi:hypothetical protein
MENGGVKLVESSWIGNVCCCAPLGRTVDNIPLATKEMSIITSPSLTTNLDDHNINFSANTCRFLEREVILEETD